MGTISGWSGDAGSCPAAQTTCTLTMDAAKSATVTFNKRVTMMSSPAAK